MPTSRDANSFTVRCPCGAALRATEAMRGKSARCPKCNAKIRLGSAPAASATGLTLMDLAGETPNPSATPPPVPAAPSAAGSAARSCPRCGNAVSAEARLCVQCGTDLETGRQFTAATKGPAEPKADTGSLKAYFGDCLKSLWIVVLPQNIVRFVVLFLVSMFGTVLLVLPWVGLTLIIVRLLGIALCFGWVCAYLFSVVISGASDDDDLPEINGLESWWEDGIVPFFKFLGTWFMVLVPAVAYSVTVAVSAAPLFDGVDPIFLSLLALGVFCWPISILVVSLGGMGCFSRPDLILKTIAQSFVPYLATCFATGLAIAIPYFGEQFVSRVVVQSGGNQLVAALLIAGLNIASWVIAMRCVGLYYRHFKERFAFSWG